MTYKSGNGEDKVYKSIRTFCKTNIQCVYKYAKTYWEYYENFLNYLPFVFFSNF